MSWWVTSKKESQVDTSHFVKYHEILTRKDTNTKIKVGDFITLKQYSFLPKKYAGCSSVNITDENYYAYVLSENKISSKKEHLKLGTYDDIRIAVVNNGSVATKQADSRMFNLVSLVNLETEGVRILKEFVADTPISINIDGITTVPPLILVRPRAHTQFVNFSSKLSSLSAGNSLKIPLYVLASNVREGTLNEKLILGGFNNDNEIEEIEVRRDLVCVFNQIN
jgi:hypothetical protein